MNKTVLTIAAILSLGAAIPATSPPAQAAFGAPYKSQRIETGTHHNTAPMSLYELQTLERSSEETGDDNEGLPFDIREEAIKDAAISYGARGGLAYRTYEIRKRLDLHSRQLDRVYDFSQLMIPAPSGFMIEPPIISENINAMIIDNGGLEAAVSDRIYNITQNAKISSTARNWRVYLERSWGDPEPPPDILLPQNEDEREIWERLVAKGWDQGVEQADEIFEEDLNRLQADFQGMVRYRILLSQGMISPPYALQVDRGVTGGGDEMRIGDRAVQITGIPELLPKGDQWRPASR